MFRQILKRVLLILITLFASISGGCSTNDAGAPMTGGEKSLSVQTSTTTEPGVLSYDINDCDSVSGVTFSGDQGVDSQILCYQARAEQLNDWNSCLKIKDDPSFIPAQCLVGVSMRTDIYLCDRHTNRMVREQCNQFLMSKIGSDAAIHKLDGLQNYRAQKVVNLQPGEDFNVQGVAIQIGDAGAIIIPDYYPATTHPCAEKEESPIAVGTGVIGAYVYLTGCTKIGNKIQIEYFKYDLPGLVFPNEI